ncbi:MAG: hypothetical protein OHK003_21150 [Anaerolineales bacterium]
MSFDHFSVIAPLYARVTYSKKDVMREVASLPVSGRLLDIGGGTGRVASAIKEYVDEIIIADVSFGMLAHSPRTDSSTGSELCFQPVCGASESLPFADDFFERVIMVDALHHVIDHAHTAREMFRVLKPGGVLVIEEPDIRTFGVKLIAIAEKLLLMRSHFLAPDAIMDLFGMGEKETKSADGTAWVIVRK